MELFGIRFHKKTVLITFSSLERSVILQKLNKIDEFAN
jgi:hypothetical protein